MSEKKDENDEDNDEENNSNYLFENLDLSDFSSESDENYLEENKKNNKKKSVVTKIEVGKKFSTPLKKLSYNRYLLNKNNNDLKNNDVINKKASIKLETSEKSNKLAEEKRITKIIRLSNNEILETPEDNNENNIEENELRKSYMKKNITKVKNSHSDLYEREKKYLIRKNNSLQKKKELELQKQLSNLKDPSINQVSINILSQNTDYIPIQERSSQFYNIKKFHNTLNEKKNQIQKIEKENKEYSELKKNKSQKKFNEKEWNNFIENQKSWQKQKSLKNKAVELMRESIEINLRHKPKIDLNSKRIINNMRKTINYQEDIYDKLYNDFNNMQERNKFKMYCSMPSFKPILNRGIKKNLFKNNKFNENNKNNNRSMEKQIETIIQKHLKNIKTKNDIKRSKIKNKTLVHNLSGINFNSKIKNKNIKNVIHRNDNNKNKNFQNMNKTQNFRNSYLFKRIMNIK